MKLGLDEITDGIYFAAINKLTKQLKFENFNVFTEYPIKTSEHSRIILDLYAEKGNDKRIYELKLGKNKVQRNKLVWLQNLAKQLGARLYIIYLEIPKSKEIEFYKIESIIMRDIERNMPSELISLATHVYVNDVESIDISSLIIDKDIIKIEGQGNIILEAQYGSPRDIDEGFGEFKDLEIEFTFKLKLDHSEKEILYSYYKFDTKNFYE